MGDTDEDFHEGEDGMEDMEEMEEVQRIDTIHRTLEDLQIIEPQPHIEPKIQSQPFLIGFMKGEVFKEKENKSISDNVEAVCNNTNNNINYIILKILNL